MIRNWYIQIPHAFKQGYRYHKLGRAFSKFYRRKNIMIALRNFWNKIYPNRILWRFMFTTWEKLFGNPMFRKTFERTWYNLDIMQQTARLVVNPNTVVSDVSSFIARRRFGPQTQWRPVHKALTSGLGPDAMSLAWSAVVQLVVFFNSGWQCLQD